MSSEASYSLEGKTVWVAGHGGMVGGALVRKLELENCKALPIVTRKDVDLRRQAEVEDWMGETKPDVVIIAAATVGGIIANSTRPAEFIYDNLAIETNIIQAAHALDVEKVLFLGSACIYPREAPQPMKEDHLLTGPLEPTNEWYAIAKIAGIKMCQAYRQQYGRDYISAQPINLYGPGDNYHPTGSHVIPAMIRKAHEAKVSGAATMEVWGTGTVRREFQHVDDMADAALFLLKNYSGPVPVNMGTGEELTIRQLAETVCKAVGFEGELVFDSTKPDGAPRKLLDCSFIEGLGWRSSIGLEDGLRDAYDWFLKNVAD
ncbi:MAG: GDP-L-fucose synthase family protein [Magnetovibrionaceae bacterium]